MGLYLKNGYVDIAHILSYDMPFNFICGGRGTGKTYGALSYVLDEHLMFMLMRRTQSQADLISKPEFNPFKSVSRDRGIDIKVKSMGKYNSAFYLECGEDEEHIGFTCALSTISNMRGFDSSDVKILIYDEFIPERHERVMKNEGSAFLNAVETIGRNRELKGEEPLKVLCLANAFNLGNSLFMEFGLVERAEKMNVKGTELYIDRSRGILLAMLNNSRIGERKKNTALYQVASDSFQKLALENDFVYDNRMGVKPLNIKEFRLLCGVGGIFIYRHKSERRFYVSSHKTGSAPEFSTDEVSIERYRKKYGRRLYSAYMLENVFFESMLTKTLFERYTI